MLYLPLLQHFIHVNTVPSNFRDGPWSHVNCCTNTWLFFFEAGNFVRRLVSPYVSKKFDILYLAVREAAATLTKSCVHLYISKLVPMD